MFGYNKATLYGNSLVDYIWIRNKVDTQDMINSTLEYTFDPTLDADSFLLARFNNTLVGGNIASVQDDILYWQVYRREIGTTTLKFITRIPASQYAIYDFGVVNNSEYQYVLFAETKNYLSAPLQKDEYLQTRWWNWSLTRLVPSAQTDKLYYADTNSVWLFDTELDSGSIQQNLSKYTLENFTQFPKISTGKKNYLTGTISAFLSNPYSGKYTDTIEEYQNFLNFIADENPKLLKDRKGNGWIVATTNNSMDYIDESAEQITQVQFEFVQLDDLSNCNVIGG